MLYSNLPPHVLLLYIYVYATFDKGAEAVGSKRSGVLRAQPDKPWNGTSCDHRPSLTTVNDREHQRDNMAKHCKQEGIVAKLIRTLEGRLSSRSRKQSKHEVVEALSTPQPPPQRHRSRCQPPGSRARGPRGPHGPLKTHPTGLSQ